MFKISKFDEKKSILCSIIVYIYISINNLTGNILNISNILKSNVGYPDNCGRLYG